MINDSPTPGASWLRFLEDWLPALAPATFLFAAILHQALALFWRPKSIYGWFWNPLSNFISLRDVPGPVKPASRNQVLSSMILTCFATIFSAVRLGQLSFAIVIEDANDSLASALSMFAWTYIVFSSIVKPYKTPPYLVMLFGFIELFISISRTSVALSNWDILLALFQVLHISLLASFIWISGSLPMKAFLPADNVARPGDTPSNALTCPEDDVTLWTWSTFSFVEPIFDIANSKAIDEGDVWSLSPFFQHKVIFTKQLDYKARYPKHSLLHFLLVSNSLDLILDLVLELWSAIMGFVPPYALQRILSALSVNSSDSKGEAFNWAFVAFIANFSFAQVDLFKRWHTRRCYERTRGQLFCTLHYKSLKRRDINGQVHVDGEEENADLGKIVNLMQGDSYAVAQRFWEFSGFFTAPVRLVIALTFLYRILGWSALAGVAVVLIAYVLNYPLAKYSIRISRSSWKASDKRMSVVNELLQNIRFLKFYGWEYRWAQKAEDAREAELKWRVKNNILMTVISFIWVWIPSAMALATFSCYTLIAKERLTVSKAFTSIALFSHLQGPMMELPGQVFALLQAYVSMQRIEAFLNEPEVPEWASTLTATIRPDDRHLIGFLHASFAWEDKTDSTASLSFQLGPLDIIFPCGQLSLIGGPTGAGKSALLAALLGEMHCRSGEICLDKTQHRVAYCGQSPWLEHATIRDNIVYNSPRGFDQERYHDVIEACALVKDLEVFDAGDMTEIGEKGVTLSGGQRARVALARAMYSEAQCILLDDPLAAVDMHTAQHIVTKCLKGKFAASRTILLVTHHLSLCLPIASYFVELEKGRITRQGPAKDFIDDIVDKEPTMPEEQHVGMVSDVDNEADGSGETASGDKKKGDGKLIEEEARRKGQISWRAYYMYIRAAGIYCWIITFGVMILIRGINIVNQIYLAKWGEAYEQDSATVFSIEYPWNHFPSPDKDVRPWISLYFYISLAGAFAVLLLTAVGLYSSLQASRTLFKALLERLSRAPVRFFDVTPIGRILNRFTTDMRTIDWALQGAVSTSLYGILNFLASLSVILSLVPIFTPLAIFIAWLYIRLAPSYIRASRDLRRLELVSLSPAFAGFDELLRGVTHVRAFGMEQQYQDRFYTKVDKFQAFDHVYWLVNGWLSWRYDCLGSVIVFASTLFALWSGVSDGFAAIVIVQAGTFADASRQLVRVAAQLELDFNSVERVVEYLDVEQEAPAIIEKNRPPAYWPSNSGGLEVENLTVHYAPHLPPALQSISFRVKPCENVGVVGRTGSGKSTLALSLLRMIEPTDGKILMDNIDISTIGLEDLRTRVTIISQDVSLFSGTIQTNLDPLGEHSTEECLDVVKRCHLMSVLKHNPEEVNILDKPVSQDSLSAGEKQLVALARAILRRTNIIIMDEATSQIDTNLDAQIQEMVREELSSAIVITIAHRLKTVMDYDRILVLDGGKIVEFDEPKVLLQKGGAFREMCLRSVDWPTFAPMLSG